MKLEDILKDGTWTKSPGFVDLSEGSERPWYVYRHTCEVSGKCYIGYSCSPVARWRQHVQSSRNSDHKTKFSRALRKYGCVDWRHEILASLPDQTSASLAEESEISIHDSFERGYNSTRGGEDGVCRDPITEDQIAARICEFYELTGEWPTHKSGVVSGTNGMDTWSSYNTCLSRGCRGLPEGSSLADLKERLFGVQNKSNKPPLSEEKIEELARIHQKETGSWPTRYSGSVCGGADGDTWVGYNTCLVIGCRGLSGGSTLSSLLEKRCGVRSHLNKPDLTYDGIVLLARTHLRITGSRPTKRSGHVMFGDPEDTWSGYDQSLRRGLRGLPGGTSLANLIENELGLINHIGKPNLTHDKITELATAHFESTGRWPNTRSGSVNLGHPGDTWNGYCCALRFGARGLPGGSSLSKLLKPLKLVNPTQT